MKNALSVLTVAGFLAVGCIFNWSCQPTTKTPTFSDILIPIVTSVAGYATNTPTATNTITSTPNVTATMACIAFQTAAPGTPCP